MPVTLKAQNSDVYQDYLGRRGENNTLYYSVKLDATRMLLDHIENTFCPPAFNGSADLRSAAGQMIEDTVKAGRRKKTVDETFVQNLFATLQEKYRFPPAT
ncbi:MAG: hypothetical protein IKM05_08080 [Clostridia bacterium]|nr:hypothetical protein [Clostridia bacterium]